MPTFFIGRKGRQYSPGPGGWKRAISARLPRPQLPRELRGRSAAKANAEQAQVDHDQDATEQAQSQQMEHLHEWKEPGRIANDMTEERVIAPAAEGKRQGCEFVHGEDEDGDDAVSVASSGLGMSPSNLPSVGH